MFVNRKICLTIKVDSCILAITLSAYLEDALSFFAHELFKMLRSSSAKNRCACYALGSFSLKTENFLLRIKKPFKDQFDRLKHVHGIF